MRGDKPSMTLPPSTPGPSNFDMTSARKQSPSKQAFGFPSSLKDGKASQGLGRNQSMSGAPDYFTSSEESSSSSTAVSRSSSTTSDHPWASLFPQGASGAATSMPRSDAGRDTSMGSIGMSSSSSFSGTALKMSKASLKSSSGSSIKVSTPTAMSAEEAARFRGIQPIELAKSLMATASASSVPAPSTLIIDIRPSTSFATARIRGSINLCAPSTLLKRSGVTVERIEEEMLSNEHDQLRFSGWKSGPRKTGYKRAKTTDNVYPLDRIVVLDTDTTHAGEAGKPSCGGGGPCLIGLLRKFELAGYAGELQWLVGGFNSFSSKVAGGSSGKTDESSSQFALLLDTSSVAQNDANGGEPTPGKGVIPSLKRSESQRRSSDPTSKSSSSDVRPEHSLRQNSLVHPRGLPMEAFSLTSTTRRSSVGETRRGMTNSVSYPTIDLDGNAAAGDIAGSACANPFYDNIRQNHELQHGITERIPLILPQLSRTDLEVLPPFLRRLAEMDEAGRAESLAKKFFDIEKAEQKRLIATMQQHAAESNLNGDGTVKSDKQKANGHPSALRSSLTLSSDFCSVKKGVNCDNSSKETFPFSIAAALERGSENRYNNIWTFEHSRVRCAGPSDYLNGSYIEPAREFGCKRRYIATQAPLPSTFATFWAVVWQQNVRTICMVTREFESGRVQSHNYWKEQRYGELSLSMVEEVSLDSAGRAIRSGTSATKEEKNDGGHLFPTMGKESSEGEASMIRRRFELSKGSEKRSVVQLQFVAWPDFSIPDDVEGIVNYMRMANLEQHKAEVEGSRAAPGSELGPLVIHCSAGVGRTGTYIAIDSVLDVYRRRRWGAKQAELIGTWDDTGGDAPKDTDVSMASPTTSIKPLPFLFANAPPRKSLKRELSPSAMDLDSHEGERRSSQGAIFAFNNAASASRQGVGGSPPPLQRSRSDEAEEKASLPFNALASSSSPPSSGFETPSGAMGSMKIAWDSPSQTPTKSRPMKQSIYSPSQSEEVLSPSNAPLGTPLLAVEPPSFKEDDVDLIEHVVATIREQRMSTVQTGRQFVFAYRVVIEELLRERGGSRGRKE